MTARKAPALAIPLPGGAVLRRPAGQPGQPLTCSRCGDAITLTGAEDVRAADRAWFAARHPDQDHQPPSTAKRTR